MMTHHAPGPPCRPVSRLRPWLVCRLLARPVLPLCCLIALSGCGALLTESTADVAGIAGAGAANAVTKSPALATGIGLGIRSGANAALQYVERNVHNAEQDRIAAAAGPLEDGAVAPWRVVHRIPIERDEQGLVTVTRVLGSDAFRCKEIVFSVEHPDNKAAPQSFYTATICRDGEAWRWASAEPATSRWGALQ